MQILNPPFQELESAAFGPVTTGQIGDPNDANPIISGEFLKLFDGANTGKLQRSNNDDPQPFLYYMDAGSTDTQTTKKGPILLTNPKRIKTKLVKGDSLSAGSLVGVGAVTYDGIAGRAGLVVAVSTKYAVGRVLEVGTNSSQPDGSYWTIMLFDQPIVAP
jgi:hypothetical protein